jgi:hypothetical protein
MQSGDCLPLDHRLAGQAVVRGYGERDYAEQKIVLIYKEWEFLINYIYLSRYDIEYGQNT